MTLHDLCAQLLPPDDYLHVDTLLMEGQRITVVGAMTDQREHLSRNIRF
jgi:hypothetical protein